MTAIVLLAVCAGCGVVGIVHGLRRRRTSLVGVFEAWDRPVTTGRYARDGERGDPSLSARVGGPVVARWVEGPWSDHRWTVRARSDLEITDTAPEEFVSRVIVVVGCCVLGPPVLWLLATMAGAQPPAAVAAAGILIWAPAAVALSVAGLARRADDRRRHFRVVVGSFVDLVVLSLAGGVGIDGALHTASQVSTDWAAQRMGRTLLAARDGGSTPWEALAGLGRALGVSELVELATTVQLAGTEGARIRESLTARSASLRRHEQADAESAANAMTERLFLPVALLLLGFLLFIGYPAFQRILGGF